MKYLRRTCCFIDYDYNMSEQSIEQKTEFRYKLKEIISSLIKDYRVNYFISGVGLGFEQSAVEIVLELKEEEYSQLTIEAVLPYESLSIEWNKLQRDKYYSIMQKIDKETLMQYQYTKDCIRKKNIYIINKSDFIIILCKNTCEINHLIRYAKSKKKTIFIIEPDTLNIKPPLRICR